MFKYVLSVLFILCFFFVRRLGTHPVQDGYVLGIFKFTQSGFLFSGWRVKVCSEGGGESGGEWVYVRHHDFRDLVYK